MQVINICARTPVRSSDQGAGEKKTSWMKKKPAVTLWVDQSCKPHVLSLFYSLFLKKITLVQRVDPAVRCAWADAGARKEGEWEGEKKKPSAGHHFYWQLVNKLKKRDAGTIFLPPFPLALRLLSSVDDNWCFPNRKKKPNLLGSDGLFRCRDWWGGEVGDIYQLDFSLCFTSSMRFSPFSSVQNLICVGTLSWHMWRINCRTPSKNVLFLDKEPLLVLFYPK